MSESDAINTVYSIREREHKYLQSHLLAVFASDLVAVDC